MLFHLFLTFLNYVSNLTVGNDPSLFLVSWRVINYIYCLEQDIFWRMASWMSWAEVSKDDVFLFCSLCRNISRTRNIVMRKTWQRSWIPLKVMFVLQSVLHFPECLLFCPSFYGVVSLCCENHVFSYQIMSLNRSTSHILPPKQKN